jgi:hypothetical protein
MQAATKMGPKRRPGFRPLGPSTMEWVPVSLSASLPCLFEDELARRFENLSCPKKLRRGG